MKNKALLAILFTISVVSAFYPADKVGFFRSPTLSLPIDTTYVYFIDFKEVTGKGTLFQSRSKEGYPLMYFRNIQTDVCFDGKCRMLNVNLYWNVTGRYLGFELPPGEFLSKTDHDPFTKEEYIRLGNLLADSLSPLATFSYEALVPRPAAEALKVDAISSPTAPYVLDYIVKGAAYTTYKLWHFVYGQSQLEIEQLTIKELSPALLLKIIESADTGDKMWAINHTGGYLLTDFKLQRSIIDLITNQNYSLSERTISTLPLKKGNLDSLQHLLIEKLNTSNYAIKKLIVGKLAEAPRLNAQAIQDLALQLKTMNGELIGNVLDIYQKNNVKEVEIGQVVAELLENENNFISQKAYKFIKESKIQDKVINKQMVRYKLKHNLSKN